MLDSQTLSGIAPIEENDPPVTVEVMRRPKPGKEMAFEEYLTGISRAAMAQPGHLGTNIFRPPKGTNQPYRIIFKFERRSQLRRWESSSERAEWRALAESVSQSCDRAETCGLEAWFTLPESHTPHPPRHKMMLLVWLGIYCLVNLAFITVGPLVEYLPLLVRTFILTALIVPIMTYLVLPLLTRLFKRWLFNSSRGRSA